MNRRRSLIKVLSLGLMFIVSCPAFSSSDYGETVSKRGTVNDDYYATGGTVNIDADVTGDVVVSGGDVFIGYRIQGDVLAAGGMVNIRGEILDDVRTAGGEINIDADIADDLVAAGGEVKLSSATSVGGEAWLAGGDVFMAGTIKKGLTIAAGNIRIAGTIHGNVELEGGEIHILEGAIIEGDLHYKRPREAKIHPGAKIVGNVTYEATEWDYPDRGFGVFFSLTLLVASIVLFLVFPGFTMSSVDRISVDPLKSLGLGFIVLVVTPVVAILLMSIVLGIWVGLSIFALYFVALLIGLLISYFFLGDWGARILHKDVTSTSRRLLSVAIVIILLGLIQLIPVIGGLLTFALLLLGLGAGVTQLRFAYSQSEGA